MSDTVISSRGDAIALDLRGHGPAVVFVAGAGPHRAIDPITTETAELLAARGVRTAVYDRPGRGESPASGAIGLDRDLAVLEAVIGAVGAPAVLCGHSSGCAISLRAAIDGLPVAGLALWEAPLAADAADTAAWAERFAALLDTDDLPAATEWYMRDMPEEWLGELKTSPMWPIIVAGAPSQRADAESLVWATAALAAGELGALGLPVLAMYGTATFPEMPVAARAIAEAVPDGTVAEVDGAEHGWDAAAMADRLAAFVRAVSP